MPTPKEATRDYRRLLIVSAITLCVNVAIVILLTAVPGWAGRQLSSRGCETGGARWEHAEVVLHAVTCPGLTLETARFSPWTRRVTLIGVRLQLDTWALGSDAPRQTTSAETDGMAMGLVKGVEVEALTVLFGDLALAQDVAGQLSPLVLHGEGLQLFQLDDQLVLNASRHVEAQSLEGALEMEMRYDLSSATFTGLVRGQSITLHHELLGPTPLPLVSPRFDFEGGLSPEPHLNGTLRLESTRLQVAATALADHPVITAHLPNTPFPDVMALLGDWIPELRGAHLAGTVSVDSEWHGEGPPTLTFSMRDLQVRGAIPSDTRLRRGPFTYLITDAQGEQLPQLTGEGTPGWTPLEDISPHLIHAVLAAEDSAFYRHAGYDPNAIAAALQANLEAGTVVRGGSTLTQQLAKNLFLDGQQTLRRKLRELLIAVDLDARLGKERVLELYLNIVQWGPGLYGIGPASSYYLLKQPSRINPREAAFLAALLPNPQRYHQDWYLAGQLPGWRIDGILQNMADAEWLSRRQASRWQAASLRLAPPPRHPGPDSR